MRRAWIYLFILLLGPGLCVEARRACAGDNERAALQQIRQRLVQSPLWIRRLHGVRVSMADCIHRAAADYKKVQATEYEMAIAKTQIDEANAQWWPIFDYEYRTAPVPSDASSALSSLFSGNLTWFHSIRLGIGVPVTGFGKLTLAKQLAQQGESAAVQSEEKERVVHGLPKMPVGRFALPTP